MDLYSSDDVNLPLLYAAIICTGIGILISSLCLGINRKQIQEDPDRGTFVETLKEMSMMDRLSVILKAVDAFTDFTFAVELFLNYNNEIGN